MFHRRIFITNNAMLLAWKSSLAFGHKIVFVILQFPFLALDAILVVLIRRKLRPIRSFGIAMDTNSVTCCLCIFSSLINTCQTDWWMPECWLICTVLVAHLTRLIDCCCCRLIYPCCCVTPTLPLLHSFLSVLCLDFTGKKAFIARRGERQHFSQVYSVLLLLFAYRGSPRQGGALFLSICRPDRSKGWMLPAPKRGVTRWSFTSWRLGETELLQKLFDIFIRQRTTLPFLQYTSFSSVLAFLPWWHEQILRARTWCGKKYVRRLKSL